MVFVVDAKSLGELHGEGGAGTADVGRSFDEVHGAVVVDVATTEDCMPPLNQ